MALERNPGLQSAIDAVRVDGSFILSDLVWIAEALGMSIRVTIDDEAYDKLVKNHFPGLLKDSVFGTEPGLSAHLFFSWQPAVHGNRLFGHFDALIPTTPGEASMFLPADAACMNSAAGGTVAHNV